MNLATNLNLKVVLDSLPSMVGYWNKDLRNVYANKAYIDWFGISPDALRGLHIRELQGEALYEKNLPYLEAALRGEHQHFERAIPKPDGTGFRYSSAEYVPDVVDNEVIGFYAIVSDITPIVEAQQDQRERKEILDGLYRLSPIGITLTDLNGNYLDFNPAFCDMLGYTPDELKQENLWSLTSPEFESEDVRQLDQLWLTRRYGPYQKKLKHKAGHLLPVEVSGMIVSRQGGRNYVWSLIENIEPHTNALTDIQILKDRYQKLYEAMPDSVMLFSAEGYLVGFNHQVINKYGYTPDELRSLTIPDFEVVEDDDMVRQHRQKIFETGHDHFITKHRLKDGRIVDIEADVTVVAMTEGELIFQCVFHDITESLQRERALQLTEERLELALDSADEGLWDWNLGSKEIFTSPRWSQMLGYEHGEIPANLSVWNHLCHPDELSEVQKRMDATLNGDSPKYEMEHRLRHKNGDWLWVLGRAKVVKRDATGRPLRVIGTNVDISIRKAAEEQLKLDSQILANVSDSVFVMGKNGRFLYVNEAAWQTRGYSCVEMMEMNLSALEAEEFSPLIESRLKRLFIDGQARFESAHRCKDGRIMQVEVNAKLLKLGNEEVVLGVARDITEQKRAEAALKASEEQAQSHAQLLRAIMESSPDVIVFALDTCYRYLSYNRKHCEAMRTIWGREIKIGMNMLDAIGEHPDSALVRSNLDRTLSGESFVEECAYGNESLSRKFWQTFWSPIRNDAGAVTGLTCIVLDITDRKRVEQRLDEKEASLRAILDNIPYLAWFKDSEGRYVSVNKTFVQAVGLTHADEIVGKTDFELWPNDLASKYVNDDNEVMSEQRQKLVEERLLDQGGQHWVETFKTPVISENSVVIGTTGIARDITNRKQIEESLQIAGLVYQASGEAMMVTDENNNIINANPAFTAITGYEFNEVVGKNPRLFKSEVHDQAFYRVMWESIAQRGYWNGEIWDKKKDGELYAKNLSINAIRDDSGRIYRYVALFADITEKKKTDELIWRQANIDPLCGLPNRRLFQDRLNQVQLKAHRDKQQFALLFIDLDHFKQINDTLGHGAGDQLLIEAAERIKHCVRECDTIARLGGDEFTIILTDTVDQLIVERIAQDLIRTLEHPFQLGSEKGFISASIGIALYPHDGNDTETLIRHADQAMYAAKENGRNGYSFFINSMQQEVEKRFSMANELRQALQNSEFEVYFQPIIEVATGLTHKAEALIRWRHPIRGLIYPAEFIPIAEETGLIHLIGDFVFSQSVRFASRLIKLNCPIQISVNKSPIQFSRRLEEFNWLNYLTENQTPAAAIAVEITEGLMLCSDEKILRRLDEFRETGIEVSIDDFGTGFSSLSYLKKFDIDYLKIDQSFVANLAHDSNDLAMIEAIIAMAHKLSIKTIAEGVETEMQFNILKACGCDFVQGFWFSRALPEAEFENWLHTYTLAEN